LDFAVGKWVSLKMGYTPQWQGEHDDKPWGLWTLFFTNPTRELGAAIHIITTSPKEESKYLIHGIEVVIDGTGA
jgi:hypothetical protein